MNPQKVLETAFKGYDAGLCIITIAADGSKNPWNPETGPKWKDFTETRPTTEQLTHWLQKHPELGIGLLCGQVSGNLEMFEFDDYATYLNFKRKAFANGLGELITRVETGYSDRTPGGGVHWWYRVEGLDIPGNKKLAKRLKRPEEMHNEDDKIKVLIETRGKGGLGVIAPSHGAVHPTGKPYTVLFGHINTIATITPDERETLFNLASSFDEMQRERKERPVKNRADLPELEHQTDRPGDFFNVVVTWDELLEDLKWTKGGDSIFYCPDNSVHHCKQGESDCTGHTVTHWIRPGKSRGASATTNVFGSDKIYVFSNSTVLDADRIYQKFSVYTAYRHDFDFIKATETVIKEGYLNYPPETFTSPEYMKRRAERNRLYWLERAAATYGN